MPNIWNSTMFDDLDWPINASRYSRGLSVVAEFLVSHMITRNTHDHAWDLKLTLILLPMSSQNFVKPFRNMCRPGNNVHMRQVTYRPNRRFRHRTVWKQGHRASCLIRIAIRHLATGQKKISPKMYIMTAVIWQYDILKQTTGGFH